MQPLKVVVPGKFWDSQIYSGRLYLFERSGGVNVLDWDRLIAEWKIEERLRLAIVFAFRRSDYLYGRDWQDLLSDSEIRELIHHKFKALSEKNLVADPQDLERVQVAHEDNPFPFPHTDSTIYKSNLYVASQKGVSRASCETDAELFVLGEPVLEWDAPVSAIATSYDTLAVAAGDEGLFELGLEPHSRFSLGSHKPFQLSKSNCVDCNWAYYSIYGSSHIGPSYLAQFTREKAQDGGEGEELRKFDRLISDDHIFHGSGYSWGNQEKLCQLRDGQLTIIRYRPWARREATQLKRLGTLNVRPTTATIQFEAWKGEAIAGRVAVFGTVIELENAIVVVLSDETVVTLPGEPINWRTFPRSKFYENHMHVIYRDRLEVFSFNQDYFVSQSQKLSGLYHSRRTGKRLELPTGMPDEL